MSRRIMFVAILLLLTTLFQGCMPETKPFAPAKVEANKALIYVYRPESFVARGSTWSLKANKKVISTYFINNGYIPVYVDAGKVSLDLYHENIGFADNVYDTISLSNVEAGKIYYIKAFMKFAGSPHFELMDNAVGAKEISKSLYFIDKMK
jgi:hypothetical protein